MNKKGFTLVELLAVIIILVVLLAIAVPAISSIIDNSRTTTTTLNEQMLVKATKNYLISRPTLYPYTLGSSIEVKMSDLQADSIIGDIKDPKNQGTSCNGYIIVTKTDINTFDYSPRLTCSEGTIVNSSSTDGLLASYKLDNNAYDSSLNNKNGTNNGATATTNRFGTQNSAMYFNGSTSINTNYDISWNNTNQVTVSFWVKPDNITDTNKGILGKKYSTYEWTFYQNTNNIAIVYWDNTGNHGGGMEIIASGVLAANQWLYFTYTWDGAIGKIYINGDLNTSRTSINPSLNMNNTAPIMIGGNIYTWGDAYFRGSVDDIKMYSRTFTAAEVLNNYKLEKNSNI